EPSCPVGKRSVGHVHSSPLMLRLASHHLPCFPDCLVGRMTPLACRDAPAPAVALGRSSQASRDDDYPDLRSADSVVSPISCAVVNRFLCGGLCSGWSTSRLSSS